MTATNSTYINDWPLAEGDYILGRPDSPIAIVTLASDYRKLDLKNYAICGTCFTEKFGIQKVIVNILSNNKSFGCLRKRKQSFCRPVHISTYRKRGFDFRWLQEDNRFKGVTPYLEEIPLAAINRFIRGIEVIDLVGTTDNEAIQEIIDSFQGKKRNEASKYSMPEIDENSWSQYEK